MIAIIKSAIAAKIVLSIVTDIRNSTCLTLILLLLMLLVEVIGLEPMTFRLSGEYSNQLKYTSIWRE